MTSEVLQALEKQRHYQKLMTFTVRSVQRENTCICGEIKGLQPLADCILEQNPEINPNRRLCLTLAKN